uniref:Uncharacterized protein n=1 Tax=Arion vulgaris TaxID=1028688 RepID=A0A0B7BDY7_9EUPU
MWAMQIGIDNASYIEIKKHWKIIAFSPLREHTEYVCSEDFTFRPVISAVLQTTQQLETPFIKLCIQFSSPHPVPHIMKERS